MDIIEILNTIKDDWPLLVGVFTLGAAWYQGKLWFKRVNDNLEAVELVHTEQNQMLARIIDEHEQLSDRLYKIESTVERIHEEIHDQEIKLAVLETKKTN